MIESRSNQRLKDIRRLRRSKGDEALLEGPHLLAEALAAGYPLSEVLATPEFASTSAGHALLARLNRPPILVRSDLLESLADADSAQGVLAVAHLPRPRCDALPLRPNGIYLYLDQIQDPGNLGALARVAEATAVAGLALSPGCAHPNHPRALRASAGSLLRLPVAVEVEPEALAQRLAHLRPAWIALAPKGGQPLWQIDLDGTLVLALGSEGRGLTPDLQRRAGRVLTIPLLAPVDSLNVTVAAAVVLFEVARRRGAS